MKCLKCQAPVKESIHNKENKYYGIESYRCISCNALFDKKELNSIESKKLNKPEFYHMHMDAYFKSLINNGIVDIPLGGGRSLFVSKILEANPEWKCVVSRKIIIDHTPLFQGEQYKCFHEIDPLREENIIFFDIERHRLQNLTLKESFLFISSELDLFHKRKK